MPPKKRTPKTTIDYECNDTFEDDLTLLMAEDAEDVEMKGIISVANPSSQLDTDSASLDAEPTTEPKAFRINAQTFSVTYPKCDVSKEFMIDKFKKYRPIDHICVCHEKHKSGDLHLHIYVRFQKKINIKNANCWDIKDPKGIGNTENGYFHPNIQATRSAPNWYNYVKEEGNYIEDMNYDFLSPVNYNKRKADFLAFKRDIYTRNLDWSDLKSVTINNIEYKNEGKKRHILLVTDPDWGKTQFIEDTFEGKAIFKANNSNYPLDDYAEQPIIIFDDYIPKASLLLSISNVYKTLTPVGATRYNNIYYKLYQQRWMFVMLNTLPDYSTWENIKARFYIIDLRINKETNSLYSEPP